jgi:hypothetical protein
MNPGLVPQNSPHESEGGCLPMFTEWDSGKTLACIVFESTTRSIYEETWTTEKGVGTGTSSQARREQCRIAGDEFLPPPTRHRWLHGRSDWLALEPQSPSSRKSEHRVLDLSPKEAFPRSVVTMRTPGFSRLQAREFHSPSPSCAIRPALGSPLKKKTAL